jgi:hypothetical protein
MMSGGLPLEAKDFTDETEKNFKDYNQVHV